jgi:ComF family protein
MGHDVVLSIADALVRVLLAPACASCDAILERPLRGPVCDACWRAVPLITPPFCSTCGDGLASWQMPGLLCVPCRHRPLALASARSAGQYAGALRQIVHAFKYERRRVLARPLSTMMKEAGAEVLAGADALVPVPLHPWRAVTRGFNQADDLARCLGLPIWRILRRRRHGVPQTGLPAPDRHANVQGAYALRSLAARLRKERTVVPMLEGRTVVLIDDVMTTGATLNACAEVLLDAGARTVRALTVARAAAGPPARPLQSLHPPGVHRRSGPSPAASPGAGSFRGPW